MVAGVSVFMTVLNEERHIGPTLDAILDQDFAGDLEVAVACGPSEDRTREILNDYARRHDGRVIVVDNPTGRTPTGLNAAIGATRHDVLVRVDGHAVIPRDYVRQAVETLEQTGAVNVGGIMDAVGISATEKSIAAAMTSPLGVGGASFHVGGEPGSALTVYLGTFRRAALEAIGGYDESYDRAQDWELNLRLREAGGLIWFNPNLRVTYRPRPTFRALARQYRDYGRWRRKLIRANPSTVSLRYLAPPTALVLIMVGLLITIAGALLGAAGAWPAWTVIGLLPAAGYAVLITIGGIAIGRGLQWSARLRVPLALSAMHMAWGWGFLTARR